MRDVVVKKRMDYDGEGTVFKKGLKGKMKMNGPQGWPLFIPEGETSGYDIAFDTEKELKQYFQFKN